MMKKISILIILFCYVININAQDLTPKPYCKCDTIQIMKDTCDFSLIVYQPMFSKPILTATKPDTNDANIVLCVPAAFTAKTYKDIVGRFVGNDTIIENATENETGLCAIDGQNIYIGSITDSLMYYYFALQNDNTYYFQQMLLINNHNEVACKIFGKQKPTFRRALATKNDNIYIVESLNRMNIEDFTQVMLQQNYNDAIYLDMGTWSEGYYRNYNNEKIIIGNLRQNTRYQTNWLVFL